jgi:formylglycine-generating enzyme required for sulfatase activity
MKRLTTLLLGLSLAVLPMMAQIGDDVDWSFAFVDEEAEIIEDGATVVRNVVEAYDEVSDVIYSGLSVMKLEALPSDYLKMHYVIEKIDNGAFQICFPITCNTQSQVGTYETSAGQLNGDLQDLQSEWFPIADGECVVTLTIEVMSKQGFFPPNYVHKGWGPTLTLRFVKGDIPGPGPEPTIKGDVNGDGEVTIADVNVVIERILHPDNDVPAADVNADGEVTIADVNAVIEVILNPGPKPQVFTVNGVSFKMIPVKGGTFTMGATPEQGEDATDSERPAHQVTLSDYSIGETEVTQALWLAVMGTNPSRFSSRNGYEENLQRPVEYVLWGNCQDFIIKLNQLTGKNFRLPTEAEWEYAARGGNMSKGYKFAGSNNVDEVAWYWGNIPSQTSGTEGYGTQTVASKVPNELGLYDMSGNILEWCQDWYGNYSENAQTDPTGSTTNTYKVLRGGCWYNGEKYTRVSCRLRMEPNSIYHDYVGLRLAL